METIAIIVLFAVTLLGYSAGAILKSGRSAEPRPAISDLLVLFVIWGGAVYSRIAGAVCSQLTTDIGKWLLVLTWMAIAFVIGAFVAHNQPRQSRHNNVPSQAVADTSSLAKRAWRSWQALSGSIGNYQSRVTLSLLFLILISPATLALNLFSDPLRLKHRQAHWIRRARIEVGIEYAKRQY